MTKSYFRFTADQYARMIEVGILTKYDKCELIHGEIVALSKITAPDACAIMVLHDVLHTQLPDDVRVGIRSPLHVADDSIPQPDVTLLRDKRYWDAYPTARDTFVVIEVSETTQEFDREVKLPLYAAAGIPETWIVDIVAGHVERYTEPENNRYQTVLRFTLGSIVESTVVPGVKVSVDGVLRLGK